MNVKFYVNNSEYNTIRKEIQEVLSFTGTLRGDSSLIDPIITVEANSNLIPTINYCYIPEFERYYFVNNITSIRNNLWEFRMHVDVLMTYADAILENYAIIQRNAYEYDLLLNDGIFVTQQNPRKSAHQFPSGFDHYDYVLAIAGN